jgi:peptide/nickel transport system permease protein
MFGYIVRRLFQGALVLLLISMATFALFFYGPSDPAKAMCPAQHCTQDQLNGITKNLGLDKPITTQYSTYMKGIFVGRTIGTGTAAKDCSAPCFGYSFKFSVPVWGYLMQRFPATVSIAFGSAVIFLFLGLLVGVVAARNRGRPIDRVTVGSTLVLSAIPFYIVMLLAYLIVQQQWKIFPSPQYINPFHSPLGWVKGMLLAWIVFGIYNATSYARYSRGSMIDSLSEDYVRTARAKGLSERSVSLKHALRSAIVPIVTIFGLDIGAILGGSFFIEYILSIHGIGLASLDSIKTGDLPIVQATVLIATLFIVIANLLTDIAYSVVDPRVRLG